MPFTRCTFFIRDGRFEWTETYYATALNLPLDQVMNAARSLADVRTQLMANYVGDTTGKLGVSLEEIRVSQDDVWRDSLVDKTKGRQGGLGIYPKPGTFAVRPERPYSVLLCRSDGNQGADQGVYRRVLYLGGIPTNVIQDPDNPGILTPPAFSQNFEAFKRELIGPPAFWGFKVRAKGLPAPEYAINKVVSPPGLTSCDITVPLAQFIDPTVVVNQPYLIIRNCKFVPTDKTLNGTHSYNKTPDPANPGQFLPFTWTINKAHPLGTYQGTGRVRQLVYQVVPFQTLIPDAETHRKRGGRSNLPLGRSLKRASSG
jgi:hypothetical protein